MELMKGSEGCLKGMKAEERKGFSKRWKERNEGRRKSKWKEGKAGLNS